MITKMKKYDFLVYHAQYDDFLEKLREIGVLHIATLENNDKSCELLVEKFNLKKRIENNIDILYNKLDKNISLSQTSIHDFDEGMDLLAKSEALLSQLEQAKQALTIAEKEYERISAWGNFSIDQLKKIEDIGYYVKLFTCPTRMYKPEWEEQFNAFVINELNNTTYFVTLTNDEKIEIEAEQFDINNSDSTIATANYEEAKKLYNTQFEEIKEFAVNNINNLKYLSLLITEIIDIDKVKLNTIKAADDTVMVLEGYCPIDTESTLLDFLQKNDIYYEVNDPKAEDNVPIKLRNNRFTKLFEPLTGMYGLPNYNEFDPTPILGPFFLLFFAMCMGDAGYGLILILFGIGVITKKIKIEMFEGLGPIITVLGVGTTVIGFFLGTFFGIDLSTVSWLPDSVKGILLKGELMGFDIQMVAAIIIGIFHICLAMVVKAICYTKQSGIMNNLSTWGWLILILGGIITAILAISNAISIEATKYMIIAIGIISALGIFIFNNIKRNPLINIGAGLWDTYNMITGILSDVLSYIRLYALGLAGAMLGQAFNQLGFMVLGDDPIFIQYLPFIIIVLIGHTLNIALSSLSAFVHPLRLTFVEYFKNLGYEGKGEKYSPLSKVIK